MDKKQIEDSLILLGPCGIGKTLIGGELSKKYGYPIFSVDVFLILVSEEMQGEIGPTQKQQEEFKKNFIKLNSSIPEYKEMFTNPLYKDKQEALINDFINSYNFYRGLIGDLKQFYKLFTNHTRKLFYAKNEKEKCLVLCDTTNKLIKFLLDNLDKPIIIDPPGPYGWQFTKVLDSKTSNHLGVIGINVRDSEQYMNKVLGQMKSVLLVPGLDYQERNPKKDYAENEMLVKHPENYHCCNLEITTNALFYEPSHPALQNRQHLNARVMLAKEKLKNSSEVSNITEEIYQRLEELKKGKNL